MQFTSAQFELFFENAADLLFIATPTGRVLACNRIFRDTIGCGGDVPANGATPDIPACSLEQLFDRPNWPSVARVANSGPTAESLFELNTISGDKLSMKGKVFVDEASSNLCGLFRASSLTTNSFAQKSTDRSASGSDANLDRSLVESLVQLHERENRAIGGRIHDSFVQDVVGAQMWLESVKEGLTAADGATLDGLETISGSLRAALNNARIVIGDLRPSSIQNGNLHDELSGLIAEVQQQTDATVSLNVPSPFTPIDPASTAVALRIIQEALRNALCHAQPSRIDVSVSCEGDDVVLTVEDNGAGFDSQSLSKKLGGVRGMQDRASILGGELDVCGKVGHGTRVILRFPYAGRFSA